MTRGRTLHISTEVVREIGRFLNKGTKPRGVVGQYDYINVFVGPGQNALYAIFPFHLCLSKLMSSCTLVVFLFSYSLLGEQNLRICVLVLSPRSS